jgi:hypothetical protein
MEMGGGQMPPPGGGQYGQGQPGQPGQPGYPPPQPQQQYAAGGQQGGPAQAAQVVQRAVRTPETKPFFLTSEFLVYLFTVIGVAIAGAATGKDGGDELGAGTVWVLITVIGLAYIISRGISKAGTKYRRGDDGGNGPGY